MFCLWTVLCFHEGAKVMIGLQGGRNGLETSWCFCVFSSWPEGTSGSKVLYIMLSHMESFNAARRNKNIGCIPVVHLKTVSI